MNYYVEDAFKVGISDLKHTKCKTTLIMDKDEDRAVPYCTKCKEFIYDNGKIRLSSNPKSKRKIISMILLMGAIEFRAEYHKKERAKGNEQRKRQDEHRLQAEPTEGS